MVDVSGKAETFREATATGMIKLKPKTIDLIQNGKIAKGDPLYTAKVAGVLAAKKTSNLIPLCHQIPLDGVHIEFAFPDAEHVSIQATARATARTGVEMEALTAVSVAALTIYDMCKAVDRGMVIEAVMLLKKHGAQ